MAIKLKEISVNELATFLGTINQNNVISVLPSQTVITGNQVVTNRYTVVYKD